MFTSCNKLKILLQRSEKLVKSDGLLPVKADRRGIMSYWITVNPGIDRGQGPQLPANSYNLLILYFNSSNTKYTSTCINLHRRNCITTDAILMSLPHLWSWGFSQSEPRKLKGFHWLLCEQLGSIDFSFPSYIFFCIFWICSKEKSANGRLFREYFGVVFHRNIFNRRIHKYWATDRWGSIVYVCDLLSFSTKLMESMFFI